MFPVFSWAGNFAFGIAAAAIDGFSPVPCTRDIWNFSHRFTVSLEHRTESPGFR